MGLELGDIYKGGLVEVEVVDTTVSESNDGTTVVMSVKDGEGNPADNIGFYENEEVLQCALDKGRKDEDGRVFIQVPAKYLTYGKKPTQWVNGKF